MEVSCNINLNIFPFTAGFLLILLLYFLYRRPNYNDGSYIKFTQTLYARRAYRIVVDVMSIFCIVMILIAIYLLLQYGYEWTQHVIALLLVVKESRGLVLTKSNGLDINSERFCSLEISRGNMLMSVWNFFLTKNAVTLDEMEVQVMKKGLHDQVAAPDDREEGCSAFFSWYPLTDNSVNEFMARKDSNNSHELRQSA